MKKTTFFCLFLSFSLGIMPHLIGQTITGNCSQVIVTSDGAASARSFRPDDKLVKRVQDLVKRNIEDDNLCGILYPSIQELSTFFSTILMVNVRRYTLIDMNTQQDVRVIESTTMPTFDNVPHGTYRVLIEHLGERLNGGCSDNKPRRVFTHEQVLGNSFPFSLIRRPEFFGVDADYQSGTSHLTNTVVVGATVSSDIQLSWKDDNVTSGADQINGFDFNEAVKLDMSSVKNYTRHQISIQEYFRPSDGSFVPTLWKGLGNQGLGGWIAGTRSGIDLKGDLWGDPFNTQVFKTVPNYTYRVQVVIQNENCPNWTDAYPDFFICPTGWNCKEGQDGTPTWAVSPNPATNYFKIQNLNLNQFKTEKMSLVISDITGRVVRNYNQVTENEFNISDLASGIYVVSLFVDKNRIYTSKLAISK